MQKSCNPLSRKTVFIRKLWVKVKLNKREIIKLLNTISQLSTVKMTNMNLKTVIKIKSVQNDAKDHFSKVHIFCLIKVSTENFAIKRNKESKKTRLK